MHRVSGAVLFLVLPVLLWGWQLSVSSAEAFGGLQAMLSLGLVKLVLVGLLWGYLHHLCAGVRCLMLDLDWGVGLEAARVTSLLVFVVSITLSVVVGVVLW